METKTESSAVMVLAAWALGRRRKKAYWDEFGVAPARETIGDWDSAAWGDDSLELVRLGMTRDDYDDCLDAWRHGLFGGAAPARLAILLAILPPTRDRAD